MKTLYLDFDGVLHPNFAPIKGFFVHLPALEEVLAKTSVQIVISSSWRFQESMQVLRQRFTPSLHDRVIGHTGPAHIGRWARWQEISRHAQTHRIKDFRSLDDAANEFPTQCPALILCNGKTGLQPPQLKAIWDWAEDAYAG